MLFVPFTIILLLYGAFTLTKLFLLFVCCIFFMSTGYYFNSTGLLACEPFFSKASYRILSSCAFYFPTTMVLMYCYGSSFHAKQNFRLASRPSTLGAPAAISEKV